MTELEALLQTELATLIEIHEYASKPYVDQNDIKGYLTHRKREVRRKIEKAKRDRGPSRFDLIRGGINP